MNRRVRVISILSASAMSVLFSALLSQAQEKLSFRIDDEVTRFAFSGDGRIAYAVRHVFSEKKIQLQRDDIWIADRNGKKHRILQGEKFVHGTGPFSYLVRALRWSPDGTKLTVDLATSEMINDAGDTREGAGVLLIDDNGKEIPSAGDSIVPGALDATWLRDGATVAYVYSPPPIPAPRPDQPLKPDSFFIPARATPSSARADLRFSGYALWAIDWNAAKDYAVAIEPGMTPVDHTQVPGASLEWFHKPHLKFLDFDKETIGELATLDGYAGGLSLSPSGDKVAYWVSNEQLEVREFGSPYGPYHVARMRVVLGTLAWDADEKRVLVKQGPVGKSGSLVWVTLPTLAPVDGDRSPVTQDVVLPSILHDLEFRQFDISPDGSLLGVVEPGRRNLLVYSLP